MNGKYKKKNKSVDRRNYRLMEEKYRLIQSASFSGALIIGQALEVKDDRAVRISFTDVGCRYWVVGGRKAWVE